MKRLRGFCEWITYRSAQWLDIALLVAAFTGGALVVGAYVFRFHAWDIGNPEQWAHFGDFIGGVLNPLIGVITIVLVVMTLRATRLESSRTQDQMRGQVEILKNDQIRLDLQKRLDGVLAEWNRMMDQIADDKVQTRQVGFGNISRHTVREVLEDPHVIYTMRKLNKASPGMGEFVAPNWKDAFGNLLPLLSELDEYCRDYEAETQSRRLTKYYKSRVIVAVRALNAAGIMQGEIYKRLSYHH